MYKGERKMEKTQNRVNFKKIIKFGLTIFTICIILFVVSKGYGLVQQTLEQKNYVEPYCSVKYSTNVEEYKKCVNLDTKKLIKKITEQERNHKEFDISQLPTINFK